MRGFSARTTFLAANDCVIGLNSTNERLSASTKSLAADDCVIGLKPTNERLLRQDDILGGGGIGGEKAPVDETPVPQVRVLRVLPQYNPCLIITGKQYIIRQLCNIILLFSRGTRQY